MIFENVVLFQICQFIIYWMPDLGKLVTDQQLNNVFLFRNALLGETGLPRTSRVTRTHQGLKHSIEYVVNYDGRNGTFTVFTFIIRYTINLWYRIDLKESNHISHKQITFDV